MTKVELTDAAGVPDRLANAARALAEWEPFGGLEAVLAYLASYTHRVAIANSRLIAMRGAVTFKWKDYRIKGRDRQKTMTLSVSEFIRRFLIHVRLLANRP